MTGFELSAYLGLPVLALLTFALGWVAAAAPKPQPIRVTARRR